MPFYSRIFSVRTIFLLTITCVSLGYTFLLIWSGSGIINSLIEDYSKEILTEKLKSITHQIDHNYNSLQQTEEKNTSDNLTSAWNASLVGLANFKYKETGSAVVVNKKGDILLSSDFDTNARKDFTTFFKNLTGSKGTFRYATGGTKNLCVYNYYEPWQIYIGIVISEEELFLHKKLFVNIVLMLLAGVILGAFLFSSFIQRLIISPLIRLSQFANQVSKGNYDEQLEGKYILELGTLKVDIQQMVSTLRNRMDQTKAQLQIIAERERWLDEALRALQESEKKYRTIYNAPSDAIVIFDPETGIIVDANKGMIELFGYQLDELISMSLCDLSSGETLYTATDFNLSITEALKKDHQLFEWMCRNNEGDIFWIEIDLQPTYLEGKKHILAVLRNIHVRKMAQEELASERERLAVTLRSIGDGVITTDRRGRVRLMNKIAESLTGWQQHEAAGRLFDEVFHIVHLRTRQPCENPVNKVLETGEMIELASDTLLVARDGREKIIADSGAPIRDPQSEIIGTVIVFRDVTEEKRMEEELFKVKKLESVGVLAGGIAHDFNNILVGVLGNISLARQCLGNKAKADEMLRNTEKATLRAKDLTAQLLTFSRGGEPVIQTTSIGSTITESAEFALRGSNVKITLSIPDDLWLVSADSGQLSQVIQNIVINSRQAIPHEGAVEITSFNCSNCDSGTETLRKKCVRIIISDNGPGIPDELLGKIFDPYFTTKDDGSGLGLAICHSIVMKHKGTISVESEKGKGTTFIIQLPVSPDQKIDPLNDLPMHSFSNQSAKILVMDDDDMILELSRQMLEYLDHEVVTCKDGEKALNIYAKAMQEQSPFDLVIMDLTIPGGMGGEKAIQKLLELDRNAKAIVSSGYSNDKVLAEYLQHGFKGVVVKPYQVEDLDQAVREALAL